jgi:cytochrome bd-type quinol oxidase subunit 1
MDMLEASELEIQLATRKKQAKVRYLSIISGISLAAALAAVWFLFMPGLMMEPSSTSADNTKLTKEEFQLAKDVMNTYSTTLKKGVSTAEKPFKSINDIDLGTLINSKRK